MKGRKEGKDLEIKGEAIRPVSGEVPENEIEDSAVLKNYVSESK